MTTIVSVADLRKELGPVLEEAHHNHPVMVSKRDKAYASVVSHTAGQFETELHQAAKEHRLEVDELRSMLREILSEKLGASAKAI